MPPTGVQGLLRALRARRPEVFWHGERVARLMDAMARRLGVGEAERARWRTGARLHDVGKLLLPKALLEARGPLSPEERARLARHVEAGAALLREHLSPRAFASLLPFVYLHHERYDGNGYPLGLEGDALPPEVALLSVADAYAAMREDRPYQRAKTHDQAVRELAACAGRQFHPRAVEVFLAALKTPAARYSPSSSALISSMNRSTLSNSRYTLANRM